MKFAAALLSLATVATLAASAQANTVFTVVNNGASAYRIDGVDNPPLTVIRGRVYVFNVSSPGHPFYIKTVQSTGTGNAFSNGVTNNGVTSGSLTFQVPFNAPNGLFYNCSVHSNMTNTITVQDPPAVPGLEPIGIAALAITVLAIGGFALRRRLIQA